MKISIFVLTVFTFSLFSCKSSENLVKTGDNNMSDVELLQNLDQKPLFNGKAYKQAFREYVSQNVRYPIEALQRRISGTVVVQFIIEKDGSVSNAKVIRSASKSLDTEALRVIKESSIWTPGVKDGETVRVLLDCPVTFVNLGVI